MISIDEIRPLFVQHGLGNAADRIIKSIKPSIQLRQADNPAGLRSRLGGTPDLPSIDDWPTRGREALTFIGQIALDEIPRVALGPLPSDGLISFYYDAEGQPSGRSIQDRSKWRVLYSSNSQPLANVQFPALPVPVALAPIVVEFVPSFTVPAMRSIELDRLELSQSEREGYVQFQPQLQLSIWGNRPGHQLLGHPDGIQGCMQRIVQFASRDLELPFGIYNYYEHPRAAELIPGAYDWQLLLQVDSDKQLGVQWGDWGRIFFWIHRDDLAAKRFENCWLFMQCG